MLKYKNLNPSSGIAAYLTGEDYIKIKFKDGSVYIYNYNKPGKNHVELMKMLPEKGKGLTTYINKYVRENYAGMED